MSNVRPNVAVGVIRQRNRFHRPGTGRDDTEVIETFRDVEASDSSFRKKRIARKSVHPLWQTKFRFHRSKGCDLATMFLVKIPPACSIGDEVQTAARTPFGLKHGFFRSTGDTP